MIKLLFICFLTAAFAEKDWMQQQILSDLQGLNSEDLREESLGAALMGDYPYDPGLVYYRIEGGKLSILGTTKKALRKGEKLTAHPSILGKKDRFTQFTYALHEVLKKYPVPDCSFLLTLRDGPYEVVKAPVLCFSKKRDYPKALLVPDTDSLGKGDFYRCQVLAGSKIYPWSNKVDKAFWRGQTTGHLFVTTENYTEMPRFKLVAHSLKHPDLVDAKFTHLSQGAEKLEPLFAPHMGWPKKIPEHLKFKYQILVDGNTCAWSRAYWQLFSNCLILKQDSDYIQWYYGGLKPFEHYVPVASDFGDLIERIEWAREHDEECHEISRRANRFALENIRHSEMLRYIYLLLCSYAELQNRNALIRNTP